MRQQYNAPPGVQSQSPTRSPRFGLLSASPQAEERTRHLLSSSSSSPVYCRDHPANRDCTPSPSRSRVLERSLSSSPASPRTPAMSLRLAPLTPNAAQDPLRKPTLPSIVVRGVDVGRYSPSSSFERYRALASSGRDRFHPYFYSNSSRGARLVSPEILTSPSNKHVKCMSSPSLTPTKDRVSSNQATPKYGKDAIDTLDSVHLYRQSKEPTRPVDSRDRHSAHFRSSPTRRMHSSSSDSHARDSRYGDRATRQTIHEDNYHDSDGFEAPLRQGPFGQIGTSRQIVTGEVQGRTSQHFSSPSSSSFTANHVGHCRLLPRLDWYKHQHKDVAVSSRSEDIFDSRHQAASGRTFPQSDCLSQTSFHLLSSGSGQTRDKSDEHLLSKVRALSPLDELDSDSEESICAENQSCPRPSERVSSFPETLATAGKDGTTGEIFESPILLSTPLCTERSRADTISCRLSSTTHQCFNVVNGKWACYRRNYLKVDAAFDFVDRNGVRVNDSRAFLHDDHLGAVPVVRFAIKLSAHVVTPNAAHADLVGSDVPLIQFGPARERGPRGVVQPLPIVPGGQLSTDCVENEHSNLSDDAVVAFRRVQIRSATHNNGHRGSSEQQYYALKLTLLAFAPTEANPERSQEVASLISQPITVRGRSKMHYAPQVKGKGSRRTSDGRVKQISNHQPSKMVSQVNRRAGLASKRVQDQQRSLRSRTPSLRHGADNENSHSWDRCLKGQPNLQDEFVLVHPAMDLRRIL